MPKITLTVDTADTLRRHQADALCDELVIAADNHEGLTLTTLGASFTVDLLTVAIDGAVQVDVEPDEDTEPTLDDPCRECGDAEADTHGMCASCLHDAYRSGWNPGMDDDQPAGESWMHAGATA